MERMRSFAQPQGGSPAGSATPSASRQPPGPAATRRRIRPRGACGPWSDGPRRWSGRPGCACAGGNRASWRDDGCSAGKYACSRLSPVVGYGCTSAAAGVLGPVTRVLTGGLAGGPRWRHCAQSLVKRYALAGERSISATASSSAVPVVQPVAGRTGPHRLEFDRHADGGATACGQPVESARSVCVASRSRPSPPPTGRFARTSPIQDERPALCTACGQRCGGQATPW